jgi:hypothetical protein
MAAARSLLLGEEGLTALGSLSPNILEQANQGVYQAAVSFKGQGYEQVPHEAPKPVLAAHLFIVLGCCGATCD